MKCPNCGSELPEGSGFCQFCGVKLEVPAAAPEAAPAPQQTPWEPAAPLPTPEETSAANFGAAPAPGFTPASAPAANGPHCRSCGAAMDPKTKRCTVCGKKFSQAKFIVPIILLAVLMVAMAGLNVYQYILRDDNTAKIEKLESKLADKDEAAAALEATIAEQETAIADKESAVAALNATISDLEATIAEKEELLSGKDGATSALEDEIKELKAQLAGLYDGLAALDGVSPGYGTEAFYTSEGIIVLRKGETGRAFDLYTIWDEGRTVQLNCTDTSIAEVSFGADSWDSNVSIQVDAHNPGICIVTISNDVDTEVCTVLIVVTD